MALLAKYDFTSKTVVEEQMKKIISIISFYKWIIDAYVSDFYTKGFWNKLPPSQQTYFDRVEPSDVPWLLSCHDKITDQQQTWSRSENARQVSVLPPLSLLALRCCISSLALQRTAADLECPGFRETLLTALCNRKEYHIKDLKSSNAKCEENESESSQQRSLSTAASALPNFKNGQCMDMQHVFRKHVKPKKQHEINNLGQIVNILSQAAESSSAVDVGAGLGHLARVLAFQHSLRVTTIEAAGNHAPKASEFDKDLRKNIHKAKMKKRNLSQAISTSEPQDSIHNLNNVSNTPEGFPYKREAEKEEMSLNSVETKENSQIPNIRQNCFELSPHSDVKPDNHSALDMEMPRHVICTVQPDIAASQFLDIMLSRHHSDVGSKLEKESGGDDADFVLVGLHACGDLTPTLLRVFLNCPTAQGLASVACCYMKMTASSSSSIHQLDNFPMSSFLRELPFQYLSYEAREMACHFADAYHQRLIENPPHLKSHSYRAALEYLLKTVDPNFKSGQARITSKIGAGLTFYQYAAENLKKLGISIDTVPGDLMNECAELTNQWKRVVAFYTLRLSLAPLVETLLLCDRALFLLEHNVPSLLVPIFDPKISPRNFALLAIKP